MDSIGRRPRVVLRALRQRLTPGLGRILAFRYGPRKRRAQWLDFMVGSAARGPWLGWCSDAIQADFLRNGLAQELEREVEAVWEDRFVSENLIGEFSQFAQKNQHARYGILNTEACLLWGLIEKFRPEVMIESGTCYGYSSVFIAEALRRYCGAPPFYTFSINRDGCLEVARRNLSAYSNCTVIEGETQRLLPCHLDRLRDTRIGVFVDGPKGGSPAFMELMRLLAAHRNISFIACHDCEQSIPCELYAAGRWPNGHLNLTRLSFASAFENLGYCDRGYNLQFMSNAWCERHEKLNAAIYAQSSDYAPYYFKESRQVSHGTMIGLIARNTP